MKKLLSFLMLLALTVSAWAGEKTITISRNDVDWESANTVYNVTKGGVELVMSGGMNNPNFLLMKQHTTITVKSHNFNIKRIVFHCLDNYTNDNLDPFYWGPRTLHIQYSQTHAEAAGTLTYDYGGSSYDALWVSTKSSSPGNYPNGLPAGYELMFENEGKPVRFASIDIVVEQEVGDIYELVTEQSEVQAGQTYILVGRQNQTTTTGRALSVNETSETPSGNPTRTSTPVELLENGYRVKATGNVQLIKLESTGNTTRPYYLKMGSNYLRRRSGGIDGSGNNIGTNLYGVANLSSYESDLANYFRTSITINGSGTFYNALIRFGHLSSETTAPDGGVTRTFAIRHRNSSGYFRDLDYSSNNSDASYQRVYLYKPAQQYKVTTEVQPEASYGSISLRDGILVDNGTNWSQKMDTVQFLVTPADGYKVKSITIQQLNGTQVVGTVDILSSSQSINGTLYNFVMPGNDANIVVEFEEVEYHNINMVVKPRSVCGNIFITEGYVVQNDQVKSYDGQNVVFNVTPNPINPANEAEGYYELSYVTITDIVTGVETTLVPDANGNYTFTMPDNEVTITAYFYDNTKSPLWLLGTANGETQWHTYGPRFNYNNDTDEYYIDAYFTGTGSYGDQSGEAFGRFSVTWKIDLNDDWSKINNQNLRGVPGEPDYLVNENSQNVYLWYGSAYENNSYKIPAGIYRIYVGTTASENKGNLHNNELKIEKYDVTLAFDPAGGADATSAVEVPQNQLASLIGDLYTKVKGINPNEADANFMYKATKTVAGDATTETENATTATSNISVLDIVNEGTTVTQLDGLNYLGWIVASNTAYYKVTETPLHWIEENGEKDKTYTVSDRLQGVYAQGSSLWCKDVEYESIVKTEPHTGQVDYLATTLTTTNHLFPDAMRIGNWDQSNWVELDFSGFGPDGNTMASALVNHFINAKTVTGVYTDDVNYTIKVTSTPVAGDETSYLPNTYCVSNFLESNLTLKDGDTGPTITKDGTTTYYYFLNPKIQEYAIITFAMWDKDNQIMVIPDNNPFSGAACIGRWDLNNVGNQLSALDAAFEAPETCNNQYEFHIIVQRTNKSYGSPISGGAKAGADAPSGKTNQSASDVIRTQPLDLQASSPLPTAINGVISNAQPVSVEYVNIAGMSSSKPWQGVNIIVTRYSNGTTTTTKMVK